MRTKIHLVLFALLLIGLFMDASGQMRRKKFRRRTTTTTETSVPDEVMNMLEADEIAEKAAEDAEVTVEDGGNEVGSKRQSLLRMDPCIDKHCGAGRVCKTMDNIRNMNVLITGAARGIGLCYAEYMLKNGAKTVAILDLPASVGDTTAANLEKKFGKGKAQFFPCDVANVKQFEETFKRAVQTMNVIDIVINNAGVLNEKNWQLTMNVNMGGVVQGSLLAIEHMHKGRDGKGGTLVNIASLAAFIASSLLPVYCASKHQVLAFSRCIEQWYDETGVRVLVICPGVTTTDLFENIEATTMEISGRKNVKEVLASFPSQGPESVAEAVVSLIQKGKNGSVWAIEGGNPPCAVEFPPVKKVELNI